METVQQNGRFTLFSSKFPSNIYSILYGNNLVLYQKQTFKGHQSSIMLNFYPMRRNKGNARRI